MEPAPEGGLSWTDAPPEASTDVLDMLLVTATIKRFQYMPFQVNLRSETIGSFGVLYPRDECQIGHFHKLENVAR